MKRWRQINAVGVAATALLVIVTGCAIPPTADRSASPIPTEGLPAVTADDQGEPVASSATPSPSRSSPPPSTAPPSTAPPDPTPAATPLTSLMSGPLRIDGLALVVADRLRVRSAPGTGADSVRLEPLLEAGTMLFLIEGPMGGSGYDWYRIAPATFGNGGDQHEFRYWGDAGPIGWVASADRDGTPWIVGAKADCPDPAASIEGLSAVERLGPLVALSCWGDATIQFHAKRGSQGFAEGFGEGAGPDPMYPNAYWGAPLSVDDYATFGTKLDRDRFPNGERDIPPGSVWNVVGHFDDEAANTCGIDGRPEDPSTTAAILTCRTTFVVTDLVRPTASVACPSDPSIADLARLGGAGALVCYGGRDLQIRAFRRQFCGDGATNMEGSPDWIAGIFGGDALLDREAEWDDQTAPRIYGRAHPSLLNLSTPYFSCGQGGWFDVTGHFDDPVSSDCRATVSDPTTDETRAVEPALSITDCRRTFVYTELRPAPGP